MTLVDEIRKLQNELLDRAIEIDALGKGELASEYADFLEGAEGQAAIAASVTLVIHAVLTDPVTMAMAQKLVVLMTPSKTDSSEEEPPTPPVPPVGPPAGYRFLTSDEIIEAGDRAALRIPGGWCAAAYLHTDLVGNPKSTVRFEVLRVQASPPT